MLSPGAHLLEPFCDQQIAASDCGTEASRFSMVEAAMASVSICFIKKLLDTVPPSQHCSPAILTAARLAASQLRMYRAGESSDPTPALEAVQDGLMHMPQPHALDDQLYAAMRAVLQRQDRVVSRHLEDTKRLLDLLERIMRLQNHFADFLRKHGFPSMYIVSTACCMHFAWLHQRCVLLDTLPIISCRHFCAAHPRGLISGCAMHRGGTCKRAGKAECRRHTYESCSCWRKFRR